VKRAVLDHDLTFKEAPRVGRSELFDRWPGSSWQLPPTNFLGHLLGRDAWDCPPQMGRIARLDRDDKTARRGRPSPGLSSVCQHVVGTV